MITLLSLSHRNSPPSAIQQWTTTGLVASDSQAEYKAMETHIQRSEKLNRWYEEKLQLHRNEEGRFVEEHFEMQDESKPQMLSFQVKKLAPLMSLLAESGVKIVDHIDETPRGRYAWFYDPEGNKVEIWEPWDESQSLIELPEPD